MISTTYKFSVVGKNHSDISKKVEEEITSYIGTENSSTKNANCEVIVEKGEKEYTAQVIARIKNDYR